MRRLKLAAVLLTAVVGLAGCGLFGGDDDGDDLGFDLDEAAIVTVFLRSDVTGAQRTAVQTRLEALPDVTGVTYESREQAYAKFKELWAEEDPGFAQRVGADSLPESFRAKLATMAAVTKVDQSATMVVFLDEDVTAKRRANVEAELRALPEVKDVTFSSADEAFRELDRLGGIAPGTENTLTDSLTVSVTSLAALRAIDDGPAGAELRELPGVQRLHFPCTTEAECRKLLSGG